MNQHVSSARLLPESPAVGPQAMALAQPANDRGVPLSPEARLAAAALSRQPLSPIVLAGAARLGEFVLGVLIGYLVGRIYVGSEEAGSLGYAASIVGGSAVYVLVMQASGSYAVPALRNAGAQLGRVLIAWTLAFGLISVAVFLAKMGGEFSRVWFAAWYVTGLLSFTAYRVLGASLVRKWIHAGRLERRAVIVGGGQPAEELIRALQAEPDNDIRICGIFDDRKDDRSPPVVGGFARLGTVAELVEFGRLARVDMLIVSLPITAESRLLQLLKQLWVLPVHIRLSAHASRVRFRPRTYSFIGKLPFLDLVDKPITDWAFLAKWLFDRIAGSLILILAAPVMAAVAVAIKIDSKGPILFKQKRYGFNNELIAVYKFRSMYVGDTDANATRLVTKGDARVTRVGRFIRRTSLDELPQLFNVVFRGNLSLVGPRPHAVQAKAANQLYDEVVDGYFARHRVKPGITGWAQVNGWRGETDTEEKIQRRVDHDLFYIENWSVLLDLYIILVTPLRLLKGDNAY